MIHAATLSCCVTFIYSSYPGDNADERKEIVVKLCECSLLIVYPDLLNLRQCLVSQDPNNYRDAPTEGIRRILEIVLGKSLPRGEKLNTDKIGTSRYIIDRLSDLSVHRAKTI